MIFKAAMLIWFLIHLAAATHVVAASINLFFDTEEARCRALEQHLEEYKDEWLCPEL